MTPESNGPSSPYRPGQDDEEKRIARESMLARQTLIEAMIDNNMRQLKFESARGGAEIERAWVVREMSRDGGDPALAETLAEIDSRMERLDDDHRRLIAEREWLNKALLEFDDEAAANRRQDRGRLA